MVVSILYDTVDAIRTNDIDVEVFGLGYVGFPLAVRLAGAGMNVTGIDVNSERLSRLKSGVLLDTEKNMEEAFFMSKKKERCSLTQRKKNPIRQK